MTQYTCKTFEHFWKQIYEVKENINQVTTSLDHVRFLYRGHASSEWKLQSTLERSTNISYNRTNYTVELLKLCFEDEQLSYFQKKKKEHDLSRSNLIKILKTSDQDPSLVFYSLPDDSDPYLTNLWIEARQYGYPSPLLDWTEEIDTALWFAFSNCFSDSAAIFLFEDSNRGDHKSGSSLETNIYRVNPKGCDDIRRNYRQSARYTVCTLHGCAENRHSFVSHIEGFEESKKTKKSLYKFIIPAEERCKVMSYLCNKGVLYEYLFKD